MTTTSAGARSLAERSAPYIEHVERWLATLPDGSLAEVVARAGDPARVAIVSVDLIVGFCHSGALASPRVAGILPQVVALLERARAAGITNVMLTQDTHDPQAEEFAAYPPHCVAGSEEARTAPELLALPFAGEFVVAEKNSISSVIADDFLRWEGERGPFTTWIIVGDCTDLCVYQAAMALLVRSQAAGLGHRVIVPADAVETYDLPVAAATAIGAFPHDGDLLHALFLHHMAQNGVEVVRSLTA